MIHQKIAFVSLFWFLWTSYAQNPLVFTIPQELSENADAVIRQHDTQIDFVSPHKLVQNVSATITVFNQNANNLGKLFLFYDKNTTIQFVSLEYFDSMGNSIRKVKKADFMDFAAVDGFSLYNDDRVLTYLNPPQQFPYTVKYDYKTQTSNTAFIPAWNPMEDFQVAVEQSSYKISYPEHVKISFTRENFEAFGVEVVQDKGVVSFLLKNKNALVHEDYSPTFRSLAPWSKIASDTFELAGVEGKADNWDEYAIWMYQQLLMKRNNLSDETKVKVKELTAHVNSPLEKAEIIYDYVQNKVRYVSVQIGIGGWMPMLTNDVDKLSYGDCKALTFYTQSLLKEAGVVSHYTLVHADDVPVDINPDIVSTQGNHAFLMIPSVKDTIYLECTSQKLPFGVTGNATQNRKVLTIHENGGSIVHTPLIPAYENTQVSIATCVLNSNGNMNADLQIVSKENQYAERLYRFDGLQPKDKEMAYKSYFDHLNHLSFQKMETVNNKKAKQFDEHLILNVNGYSVLQPDKSMILNPNFFNRRQRIPVKNNNRVHPFVLHSTYQDLDQYSITLPDHYTADGLPVHITYDTEFGKYKVNISQNGQQVEYRRELTMLSGTFPKEKYESFRTFLRNIKKSDETKLLLIPKNP